MKKYVTAGLFVILGLCVLVGFEASASESAREITLMTHDSFSASKGVVSKFEKENGVKLKFLKAGDAGAALNQAILSKNNPMADVFFGVDNTFFSRAIGADIFISYASPVLSDISDSLKLDPKNRLLPVDFGDVCINYDKKWFSTRKMNPPTDISDLAEPEYKSLTVVENPATSSPGLAFLFLTVGKFGDDWIDYWKKLNMNDVLITDGWKQAYWGHFTAASKGNRPIVVSYATSPPAEVHFSEKKLNDAPTRAVVKNKNAYRQIEFIGILKGTKHRKLAEKLVDFILGKTFQEDIPLQMFVFPANRKAMLPDVFVKYAAIAKDPVTLPYKTISGKREEWIRSWTEQVLR